jgi:hypothetical protein
MSQCIAYNRNGGICRNGFIQRHGCWAGYADTLRRYLPHCLQDELPDHWVDESGKPKFRPATEQTGHANSPHPENGTGLKSET